MMGRINSEVNVEKAFCETIAKPFDVKCPALPGSKIGPWLQDHLNMHQSSCIERSKSASVPHECRKCVICIELRQKNQIIDKPKQSELPRVCGDCQGPVEGSKKFCATCKVIRDKASVERSHSAAKKRRIKNRIANDQEKLAELC